MTTDHNSDPFKKEIGRLELLLSITEAKLADANRLLAVKATVPIAENLYTIMEKLGADEDLMTVIGSWGDEMTDPQVLEALTAYNRTGSIWKR